MNNSVFTFDGFHARHIGPDAEDVQTMLDVIGVESLDALIDQTVPSLIRSTETLDLPDAMSEYEYISSLKKIARKNKVYKSYIGQGYYNCITPNVILRNMFENPGWYTQYTPYQPEIAQGRLEALLNFQTMITDMTAMEIANASLLDEGTAAAEAMSMLFNIAHRSTNGRSANKFFVSEKCFMQTIDVVKSRALPLNIEVMIGDHEKIKLDHSFFGALVQYPDGDGEVRDYKSFIDKAHTAGCLAVVASDLMSLALLTPPGEFGADVVIGNSQRFGVPMGYGGPHAAFFATRNEYIRQMPGRIIGVTIDAQYTIAYRMTLQTREQHIRREKATSNICTAQALLAIIAGMYAVYHGPEGIKKIGKRIRAYTMVLESELRELGFDQRNKNYFDTLNIRVDDADTIHQLAREAEYNFRYIDKYHVGISLDETTQFKHIRTIRNIFSRSIKKKIDSIDLEKKYPDIDISYSAPFNRTSAYLQHPVFNTYHPETELMRYIKTLENKDLSLAHAMIPLGSCTMKLNAATEMIPVSWPEFSYLHPFVPLEQAQGYQEIFNELSNMLCTMTGLDVCSFQPNAGAQGEFTGLLVIRAFHADHGQPQRKVALIPSSAHGTNPASAVLAGMQVVVVKTDEMGNIDLQDLKEKAERHKDTLAALMVTYPSTFGVFEDTIKEICDVIHANGGLLYMDGANLNAQVGLTSPGIIGADVCHINLHKTFSIPHGGGGPGMGPICVTKHLAPYLPGHSMVQTGGEKSIPAVASAPWSSASILLISYGYIKMLGRTGVIDATKYAILNANYLKTRLEKHYSILYQGKQGRVAHEFILNMKPFKDELHVEVEDIAKRLIDYSFHPPTVSFPVAGTLMIEPTESESKAELDRFTDALISIRKEMQEIAEGKADAHDNVLKNAPHSLKEVSSDDWTHVYHREKAVYPVPSLRKNKFWSPTGRINNTYGDKNILCTCPPVEEYAEEADILVT